MEYMTTHLAQDLLDNIFNGGTDCIADIFQEFFCKKISSLTPEDTECCIKSTNHASFGSCKIIARTDRLNTNEALLVIMIEVKGGLTSRSSRKAQFEVAKQVLALADAGIFIFYDNHKNFRISFISKDYQDNTYTSWRRYTFYINSVQSNKTFQARFNLSFGSLAEIQQAFAVEPLTEAFYIDLYEWFQLAVNNNKVTFPNLVKDEKSAVNKEVQIIRLITRIVFIWFLKQKSLIPDVLFDDKQLQDILSNFNPNDKSNSNYYNAILQNLFFANLNKPINERSFARLQNHRDIKSCYRYADYFKLSEDEVIGLFASVPFVNGGLFECLDAKDIQGNEYLLDGFSRNTTKNKEGLFKYIAQIPNNLFFDKQQGLIAILSKYNFTVDENTQDDMQVSLDPEIMGLIFENLLASYNPSTKETARKKSGAFYTPKNITSFMVDNSLLQYLDNHLKSIKLEYLEKFIFNYDRDDLADNQIKEILDCLSGLRILDPACGSGAFLLDYLHKIVKLFELSLAKDITDKDFHKKVYNHKLEFIKNCLYGVDIQPIAVQICKLRFFISLICEQEKDATQDNFGIQALPNLETKFIIAYTLNIVNLPQDRIKYNLFHPDDIFTLRDKLFALRKSHFTAKSIYEKTRLREQDTQARQAMLAMFEQNADFTPKCYEQLAIWDPYNQNTGADFFNPEWMFNCKDFSIVIANPPYIQLQKNGGALAKKYQGKFEVLVSKGDIYQLFIEQGVRLLKEGGVLAYITSNKWLRARYGHKLRQYLLEHTQVNAILDLGEGRFSSALVDTNITIATKHAKQGTISNHTIPACEIKTAQFPNWAQLKQLLQSYGIEVNSKKPQAQYIIMQTSLSIDKSIKIKLEQYGRALSTLPLKINRGITTGLDKAFIIDEATKDKFIAQDARSSEIIKPVLTGKDVGQYCANVNTWIIHTHNGVLAKNIPKIDIDKYPVIQNYLDKFKAKLVSRDDQGDTPYNLRGCTYIEDFEKEKIVYSEITNGGPQFCLDKARLYIIASVFMITGEYLAYYVALFNSKLLFFGFKQFYAGGG